MLWVLFTLLILFQEIKTEMEFVHIESDSDLPPRLGLTDQDTDKVGITVASKYNIEDQKYQQSQDKKALVKCLEQDMQETNENICRSIEDVLYEDR